MGSKANQVYTYVFFTSIHRGEFCLKVRFLITGCGIIELRPDEAMLVVHPAGASRLENESDRADRTGLDILPRLTEGPHKPRLARQQVEVFVREPRVIAETEVYGVGVTPGRHAE